MAWSASRDGSVLPGHEMHSRADKARARGK